MKSKKIKDNFFSTHKTDGDYVILMETSGEEYESWYYFIRLQGNEEALKHLEQQLDQIEWQIIDNMSTFDLDLKHTVSAQTAKEMTKVELNALSFHRKFDGKLQKIDFGFRTKDFKRNEKMICKVFDLLSYGQIENFIDDEDIDEEDLISDSDDNDNDDDDDEDQSANSSDSETDNSSTSSKEEHKKIGKIPNKLL